MMAAPNEFLSGYIGRLAKVQEQKLKAMPKRVPIPPSEQVQRFLTGAERWRVDKGLVTPAQFAEYEMEMLKRIQAEQRR